MRILFLGLNYAPEKIGIAVYSAGLCRRLAEMGHEVRAIVGKPYYPEWKIAEDYGGGWKRAYEAGVDVIRCPLYVPRRPSGFKRIIHHMSFAAAAFGPTLRTALSFWPHVIITVAPSLVAAPVAALASRAAGSASWLHIQDFEVEAAFATGLLNENSLLARAGRWFETRVIRFFDGVSSISPEMCAKLIQMGLPAKRIFELRNWADVALEPLAESSYRDEWHITTPHIALYSGNIANKQGIEIVLEAAGLLRNRSDLTFIICGQGANRAALEKRAASLPNIRFHDLQPSERLSELLALASIHLLPQKESAADLVLPSKLTNMLASGRPVVATAAPHTGLAREIQGCGFATSPGDAKAFADAIERILDNPKERDGFATAARNRAEQVWDRDRILTSFEKQLRSVVTAI